MNRAICAFWVLTQTVSLPSAHRAAAARPSSGTGASRWFVMTCSTTTSQPSKAALSAGVPVDTATFDPAGGNSSDSPASAAVDAYHRGQRLVVHADQLGGVLALVAVVGDHHRDRLADEAHPVDREQRLGPVAAKRQRRAFGAGQAAVGRRRRQIVQVGGGQHGYDSRRLARRRDIDAGDQRVRDRAAHERDPGGLGQFRLSQVIDVGAAGRQQPRDPRSAPLWCLGCSIWVSAFRCVSSRGRRPKWVPTDGLVRGPLSIAALAVRWQPCAPAPTVNFPPRKVQTAHVAGR